MYDGTRMHVGPVNDEDYARLSCGHGRGAEILRRLRDLREHHADLIRTSFPHIPRRVSGYNLPSLLPENGFQIAQALVGSESTCVLALEATVKLIPFKNGRSLLVLGYPDVVRAAEDVPRLLEYRPIALEGMDDRLIRDMRNIGLHPHSIEMLPDGNAWLLIEFDGDDQAAAKARVEEVMQRLREAGSPPSMRLFAGNEAKRIWEVRESGLGATAHASGNRPTWPGWEDSAVPPERLSSYLHDLRRLLQAFGYEWALYGHFGQGCVHTRIDFDLQSRDGIAKFRAFLTQAADLVVRHGGSLSGEHGDGQARGELLSRMYPPGIIDAFREFKAIFDPDGKMNPGKIIDANPVDADLRLGPAFARLPEPRTRLAFPNEEGDFKRVSIKCVGVGKCRRSNHGTMCPSYMATREEKHSTRGRARMLFEMVKGEVVRDGWQSEEVKDSLDLCLACKGCKGECPVHVDMAAYKAEFLSHYYEGHRRARSDYALGLIHTWSRIASFAPALANLATQTPGMRDIVRTVAGLSSRRRLPPFAERTFVEMFRGRKARPGAKRKRVLLWPDTFNNNFNPHVLASAVDVLEASGYAVEIPARPVCCGRPLYYFGRLEQARLQLRRTLDVLRPAIDEGVPIVGVEPSCISTFSDELHDFAFDDSAAARLSKNAFLLGDFLADDHNSLELPRLEGRALLHEHCHHKAVMHGDGDVQILERLGLAVKRLDSGCCGLAGPFGFERDHYDVSMRIGERVLLPAVRAASLDTFIIADGFACREQIAHATERRALHPVEVMRLALLRRGQGVNEEPPERAAARTSAARVPPRTLALVGAAAMALVAARSRASRRRSLCL